MVIIIMYGTFWVAPVAKNPPANAGDEKDWGLIPGSGRFLEEEMAPNFKALAWKFPWAEEPRELQSMRPQRVGQNWATEHTQVMTRNLAQNHMLSSRVYRDEDTSEDELTADYLLMSSYWEHWQIPRMGRRLKFRFY